MQGVDDSDEELLRKAVTSREGDLQAFERLVRRHQAKVLANCRYMTRDATVAEDLAQEVFVKAYFALRRFEGRSSFRTWLHRIKVHHCLNHLKKERGRTLVSLEDPALTGAAEMALEPAAERDLVAAGEREGIARTLDALSDTLRIPLLMRDMDGLSYEDVAATLGISLSAAKMRIKRGREEFRRRYETMIRQSGLGGSGAERAAP